ncbi:hypothetical protein D3C72_1505340 [compost metagenome]
MILQQPGHGLGAFGAAGTAADDPLGLGGNAVLQQLAHVTAKTLGAADGGEGSANEGDVAMAKPDQVLGRQLATKEVVGTDEIQGHVWHLADHQDCGDPAS